MNQTNGMSPSQSSHFLPRVGSNRPCIRGCLIHHGKSTLDSMCNMEFSIKQGGKLNGKWPTSRILSERPAVYVFSCWPDGLARAILPKPQFLRGWCVALTSSFFGQIRVITIYCPLEGRPKWFEAQSLDWKWRLAIRPIAPLESWFRWR